jgi:hypothetical protein
VNAPNKKLVAQYRFLRHSVLEPKKHNVTIERTKIACQNLKKLDQTRDKLEVQTLPTTHLPLNYKLHSIFKSFKTLIIFGNLGFQTIYKRLI